LGVLARFCKSKFWEISIDKLLFDRSILSSIDRVLQKFRIFQAIQHEFCHSSLINQQNIKTQKLTKASENNKAKGLTYVNQGVQIYNIWHSSLLLLSLSTAHSYPPTPILIFFLLVVGVFRLDQQFWHLHYASVHFSLCCVIHLLPCRYCCLLVVFLL